MDERGQLVGMSANRDVPQTVAMQFGFALGGFAGQRITAGLRGQKLDRHVTKSLASLDFEVTDAVHLGGIAWRGQSFDELLRARDDLAHARRLSDEDVRQGLDL